MGVDMCMFVPVMLVLMGMNAEPSSQRPKTYSQQQNADQRDTANREVLVGKSVPE